MSDKPKKYELSEEQREKYRQYQREQYKKNKTQLKKYHDKPIEQRKAEYQANREVILTRIRECYTTKRQLEKNKDLEIYYLRELVKELQDEVKYPIII